MQFKWLQIFCLCAAIQFQFIEGNQQWNLRNKYAHLDEPFTNNTETETNTSPYNESEAEPPNSETTTHPEIEGDNRVWGNKPRSTTTTSPVHRDANRGSQLTSHICTKFTEYYDCQIRDVHLKNGEPSVFGLTHNNQKNLTFADSTLEYLPKSLIDAFPYVALLNLNDLKIASIRPNAFERAAYLKTVYLEGNRLISIDRDAFRGANNLQMLVLSKNEISFIDNHAFGFNSDLQYLYLDQNQLDKLPSFASTASLQFLNASHNNLTSLDDGHFYQLGQLQTLDLSFNRLRRLDLQQLRAKNLDLVDVSFNKLTSFSMPTHVTTLNARDNLLHEFIVGQPCMLKKVDLAQNKLETQPVLENCWSLEYLDLSYNLLETFLYKKSMDKLQTINLAHNHLFEIQLPIRPKGFAPSLREFDLSHNKLSFVSSLDVFKKLDFLYLNDNKLIKFKSSPENTIQGYRMANNEWDCDDIKHFESKTQDKNSKQCAQGQQDRNGICCRTYSKPFNDRLNEVLQETDFHERSNQKKCSKPVLATSNQNTNLDEIRNAMAHADSGRSNKLKEIENATAQKKSWQRKLEKVKSSLSRLTNSKHNVADEIEKQRKSHRVIKEGLISDKEMLERIIKFVQERDAFNNDLLSRRQNDTEASKALFNEKQREFDELNQTIGKLKNDINLLKKDEKDKKRDKDLLEKRVNKNSASIHGSSGTIIQ